MVARGSVVVVITLVTDSLGLLLPPEPEPDSTMEVVVSVTVVPGNVVAWGVVAIASGEVCPLPDSESGDGVMSNGVVGVSGDDCPLSDPSAEPEPDVISARDRLNINTCTSAL